MITICGAFDFEGMATGGQPVKTRELYYALCDKFGSENIKCVETFGWKKSPFSLIKSINRAIIEKGTVIMLPAQNGLKVFLGLFLWAKRRAKISLFYDVIGGWLPDKAAKSKRLLKKLKKLDGIWVETEGMKGMLNELGLDNVHRVPNFRKLNILNVPICVNGSKPFKLCTFSRVMREKGISDAVEAIRMINAERGEDVFKLDIYGPIDDSFRCEFEELCKFSFVEYKGVVETDNSTSVLKDYYALLFPTYYDGEGFAGTLLDAFASGVPVLASDWRYNSEIVLHEKTGLIYPPKDVESLKEALIRIETNPDWWQSLRQNCLDEAKKYDRRIVIEQIIELLKY